MERRDFLKKCLAGAAAASVLSARARPLFAQADPARPVRFGLIGVGGRGTGLMNILLSIPGTQVTAICDINEANLNQALKIVREARGNTPAAYSKGEYVYREMLKRDDFDAVIIATSIKWHGRMSIDAMLAGKHVGSEVPACQDLKECWGLVKAREKMGVHYLMMENYLFTQPSLAMLNMTQQGLFGDPYYAECGYIHEYKAGQYEADGSLNWRGELMQTTYGNHYPTHSGGPVFKWLGINEGDRLARLSCYATTPNRTTPIYYAKRFGKERAAKLAYRLAEMTTCLITTAQGKVIKMDLDVQSNRPHSFYYLFQGTQGIYDSRSGFSFVDPQHDLAQHPVFKWEDAAPYLNRYEHPLWKKYNEEAARTGHGGGDYFVVKHLVDMVRHDREPWIDVYDAASWSAIFECTRRSLDHKNAAIEIPDFTGGRWKDKNWRQGRLV